MERKNKIRILFMSSSKGQPIRVKYGNIRELMEIIFFKISPIIKSCVYMLEKVQFGITSQFAEGQ